MPSETNVRAQSSTVCWILIDKRRRTL